MKQVVQWMRTGRTELADVAAPGVGRGALLIRTSRSLISTGTERMLVGFGKAGWLEKARQQPDKVRMVLDKIRTDGVMPTIEAVMNKLDQPLPLGYCNVGTVIAVGSGVNGFAPGDRVLSNGKHAEVVSVPSNLCAKIPDSVPDEEAAFTVLGAIGLQGIRLAAPTLGESVAVMGLGLIGLMTVQLLQANGCRVLGIDYDPEKLAKARQFGAQTVDLSAGENPVVASEKFSRGRGMDAVLITASTQSNDPVHQAALMSRKRGRIVLVGVAGLELSRADFYEKELTFQVSCSYGPGRYDPNYEEKGIDYPAGFVRWTEQRNFEAVLDMLGAGRIDVKSLISHRYVVSEAEKAYEVVVSGAPSLGIILSYPEGETPVEGRTVQLPVTSSTSTSGVSLPAVSFLGAGNYANAILIPAFRRAGARFQCIASAAGVSGMHAGRKFGFRESTTDASRLIDDRNADAIVITTRHDTHAGFVIRALDAGKHVFVEKPLCMNMKELENIQSAYERRVSSGGIPPILMVGFNRRFAPQVVKMKQLLASVSGPRNFVVTVNAGSIPSSHWTQDPESGGGRIIGEACHFVDLVRFLAGVPITAWNCLYMDVPTRDSMMAQFSFADGSVGAVHYLANGGKAFPKERIEVFAGGGVLQLDNFRTLRGYNWPGFSKLALWRQDKGQASCARAFLDALSHKQASPIPADELFEVTRVTLGLASSPDSRLSR